MSDGFWKRIFSKKSAVAPDKFSPPEKSAHYGQYNTGTYRAILAVSYDGEKNLGEIGPIKEYYPDYVALRARSWQLFLDSDIAQTVLNKYQTWVMGVGLKLQCQPEKIVLASERITLDVEGFNDIVEARFGVFARSRRADYSGMRNLHRIAKRARHNAIVGGDVLVILRFTNNQLTVQLIDGAHVCSPLDLAIHAEVEKQGNEIRHGVELSSKGQHVAYHVKKKIKGSFFSFETVRIPARNSDGMVTAFLLYGLEYRLDNVRGLPLLSAVMESIKKLDRYKEASVGKAEEIAKVSYQVVHQAFSDGENPLSKNLAKALNADANPGEIPRDVQGKELANTVAATTNKQAFNNPIGSEIKTLSNQGEINFKDFFTTNRDAVCSALQIPPEVAQSIYNSNFSASRAALKDWEHTLNVLRSEFSEDFYQQVYNLWLDMEVLRNKIQAPGYLQARIDGDHFALDAYRHTRWVGASVPHIDPLKEVNAERAKLGPQGVNIPLTTVEQATEALNGGDSDQNMAQFADELNESRRLKIIPPPKAPAPGKENQP